MYLFGLTSSMEPALTAGSAHGKQMVSDQPDSRLLLCCDGCLTSGKLLSFSEPGVLLYTTLFPPRKNNWGAEGGGGVPRGTCKALVSRRHGGKHRARLPGPLQPPRQTSPAGHIPLALPRRGQVLIQKGDPQGSSGKLSFQHPNTDLVGYPNASFPPSDFHTAGVRKGNSGALLSLLLMHSSELRLQKLIKSLFSKFLLLAS